MKTNIICLLYIFVSPFMCIYRDWKPGHVSLLNSTISSNNDMACSSTVSIREARKKYIDCWCSGEPSTTGANWMYCSNVSRIFYSRSQKKKRSSEEIGICNCNNEEQKRTSIFLSKENKKQSFFTSKCESTPENTVDTLLSMKETGTLYKAPTNKIK